MSAIDDLRAEHEGIRLMLQILENVCERLESGKRVDPDHLERIVEFFSIFADKCHHAKEEEMLFPEMEKSGIPKESGPIGVMLSEHEEGREFVKGMKEGVAKIKAGGPFAAVQLTGSARKYVDLLSRHIDKENNVLFPMADNVVSKETQDRLQESFEALERERIGIGKHEEFHSLLHHLKKVYLD
jgi:hemerythrin-like domain-containing protein